MKVVIVDTETGGLLPHHPTIQIAAIAVDEDWDEVEAFEVKLGFDPQECEFEALKLGPYDPAIWEHEAKSPAESLRQFSEFLSRHADVVKKSKRTGRPYQVARLAGHNIATFDVPRLQAAFSGEGMFLPAEFGGLDTLQLYRWLRHLNPRLPDSGRLADVTQLFGVDSSGAHDALADCRMTAAIIPHLLRELGKCLPS